MTGSTPDDTWPELTGSGGSAPTRDGYEARDRTIERIERDVEGLAAFLPDREASRVRDVAAFVRAELAGHTEEDFWFEAGTKVTGEIVARVLAASGGRFDVKVHAEAVARLAPDHSPSETRFDEIVAALSQRRLAPREVARGEVVRACCPAHDDDPEHPSLAVRKLEDGSARIKCWDRDCPPDAILSALGLDRPADVLRTDETSWIRSISFDRAAGAIRTETHASTYLVRPTGHGASIEDLYRRFRAAESKGTFFNEEIRRNPVYSVEREGAAVARKADQIEETRNRSVGARELGR